MQPQDQDQINRLGHHHGRLQWQVINLETPLQLVILVDWLDSQQV
jgi:hypothetical protein